jgi:hypothetical protein
MDKEFRNTQRVQRVTNFNIKILPLGKDDEVFDGEGQVNITHDSNTLCFNLSPDEARVLQHQLQLFFGI